MEEGKAEQSPEIGNPMEPESNSADFNRQFETRQRGNTANGDFEYVHIVPKNPQGDPLIYHLGWLAGLGAGQPGLKEAYDLNQETYTLDLIGHKPPKTRGDEAYDAYTLRNAQAMAQIAIDQGLKHVNLVGHSEGTSVSLVAAQLLLDQGIDVRNVVLVNPTGFGLNREKGLRTKTELVKRGLKMTWQEFIRGKNSEVKPPKVELDIKHILRHPVHVSKEGLAMANLDMAKLVEEVTSSGVNVSIIQSEDDTFVMHEDLNTELQLAARAVREAEIKALREKTEGMEETERQKLFAGKVAQMESTEEEKIVTAAIGKPGHLFLGHQPKTYMQTVIPLLRHQRQSEIKRDIHSRPKALQG